MYTKEQIIKGMKAYYKDMRENTAEYIEEPDYNDQQAIDAGELLIEFIEKK